MQQQYERTQNFEKKQEYVCCSKPCSCLVFKTNDAVTDHLETSLRPNRCQPANFFASPTASISVSDPHKPNPPARFPLSKPKFPSPLMCLEHPPSRGAVHITPSDPTKLPETGPGYFCNEVDSDILAVGIRGLIGDEAPSRCEESWGETVATRGRKFKEVKEEEGLCKESRRYTNII